MDAGGWGAAITAVFTVAALLLQAWASSAPQRNKEQKDEETQADRAAIGSGDAVALGAAIDSVPATSTGDPAGLSTDSDTARGLAEITGG